MTRLAFRTQKNASIIGIHLDFKGVLFKPSYIPEMMRDLADQGINTILAEYEDIFPFKGLSISSDPSKAWTKGILHSFLLEAERYGIEIIPLQQALGHLEYLLRLPEYRHLAEEYQHPHTICLSNSNAKKLIFEMVRQVMDMHPKSRFIHLGMDEADGLASCPKCQALGGTLKAFIDYLKELCTLVEEYGKTPIVWTDMLQDHFQPGAFKGLEKRVIFMPWDYYPTESDKTATARFDGLRVSNQWLANPSAPHAPNIYPKTTFSEDWAPSIKKLVRPYWNNKWFLPLFYTDIWTKMGFRIIGASAMRFSEAGPIMAAFTRSRKNFEVWKTTLQRTKQMGQIATSWARAGSWYPPNHTTDILWPSIADLASTMGAAPKPFWPEISQQTLTRITDTLSKCREEWSITEQIIEEMEELLASTIRTHTYEWKSLILTAKILHLHKDYEEALDEVERFGPSKRTVDTEWERMIKRHDRIIAALRSLKTETRQHFKERYHGKAFNEWLEILFDLPTAKLRTSKETCKKILAETRKNSSRIVKNRTS